jgi:hypothetical protein
MKQGSVGDELSAEAVYIAFTPGIGFTKDMIKWLRENKIPYQEGSSQDWPPRIWLEPEDALAFKILF